MHRILCIDEVAKLFSTERTIVYDLFEWPYTSSQLLIVIGIANSIDLIEKSLPLLKVGSKKNTLIMKTRKNNRNHGISFLFRDCIEGNCTTTHCSLQWIAGHLAVLVPSRSHRTLLQKSRMWKIHFHNFIGRNGRCKKTLGLMQNSVTNCTWWRSDC